MSTPLEHRLFSIIKKCYQAKFWETFEDSQLVAIQLAKEKEPIFISIMGKATENYGFLIYRGYQQLAHLYQSLHNLEKGNAQSSWTDQDCLAIYYEDREKLRTSQYHRVKDSGVTFRGRKAWPILVDFTPGFAPTAIKAEQLWLVHALEAFYDTATSLKDNMAVYHHDAVQSFHAFPGRNYDQDGGHQAELFSVPSHYRQGINIDSLGQVSVLATKMEVLKARLLDQGKDTWELAFYPLNELADRTEDDKQMDRPFFPILLMLANQDRGDLMLLELVRMDDPATFQRALLDQINLANHRPKAIAVHDKVEAYYIQSYLGQLMDQLGVPTVKMKGLPILDEIQKEVMAFDALSE